MTRSLVVAPALPLPVNGGDAMRTLQNAVSLTSEGPVGVFGLRTDAPTDAPLPGIELWRSSRDASLTDPSTATSLAADSTDGFKSVFQRMNSKMIRAIRRRSAFSNHFGRSGSCSRLPLNQAWAASWRTTPSW